MADTETNLSEELSLDSHKARRHSDIRVFSGSATPSVVEVAPDEVPTFIVSACEVLCYPTVRSDLVPAFLSGCTNMLDLPGRRKERKRAYAALQLPALRTRGLLGEVAASVCRLQVNESASASMLCLPSCTAYAGTSPPRGCQNLTLVALQERDPL